MNFLKQDVRLSLRLLLKSPGFAIAAVLTLAMGIGANAVVFGVMDALVLHPMNVPDTDSLYALWRVNPGTPRESYPDYLDLRDHNHSFDDLVAYNGSQAGLDTGTGEDASRAWTYETSGNYFDALGIQPYLGRFFHSSDEHGPNSAPYIVLGYSYWHTHFQDDRGVVGRKVRLNQYPFTIIGVAPPDFHGTLVFFFPDLFVPLVNREQLDGKNDLNARGERWVQMVLGHLKHGVTPAQAIGDLNSIGASLEKSYPSVAANMSFTLVRPFLYGDEIGRSIRAFMMGLTVLAGLILLAACANLGILFSSRAADRSSEVALRLALGSSRKRIVRQLFTEALLISIVGGAVGLLASLFLLRGLDVWQPVARFPVRLAVHPGPNLYGLAGILTVASGFFFSAVAVRHIVRTNPYEIIKSGATAKPGRWITARDLLLVTQIAICAVLVTASMVAVRGLVRSLDSKVGFEPESVILADTDLTMVGYSAERIPAMQKRMMDDIATIPGVKAVGLAGRPQLAGPGAQGTAVYTVTTTDLKPSNIAAYPFLYRISPEYLDVAGTALLAGRALSWHDDSNSPPVAVVNREFANRIFSSVTKAVGGYYKSKEGIRIQVVGVVEDGKYGSLTENPQPAVFLPILQSPSSETWLVVRSNGDQRQLATALKNRLRGLDAGMPVFIQSWTSEMDAYQFGAQMATISLGVLGVMGAILSITGIFGIAAYTVSKRLRELAIRVSLGAGRKGVLHEALGRALKLLVVGSAAGLVLGILASRVLAFIVYQATPRDPLVLFGVVLTMSLLGLIGTWIPARSVLKVDPAILLREK
jgi:predicted permease